MFVVTVSFCCCSSVVVDPQLQDEQLQQQNDTVTTTTTSMTKQINLHKLFNVQELRSPSNIPMYDLPLQELNMKCTEKLYR